MRNFKIAYGLILIMTASACGSAYFLPNGAFLVFWNRDNEVSLKEADELFDKGKVLFKEDDYSGAAMRLRAAAEIRETILGPDHPDLAACLSELGNVQAVQGLRRNGELLIERALQIQESALGNDHLDVATTIQRLAFAIFDFGDDERLESLFLRELKILEKRLGPWHPRVANALNSLAALNINQHDYDHAKNYLLRAEAILFKSAKSDENLSALSNILNNLSVVYSKQHADDLSIKSLLKALTILRNQSKPELSRQALLLLHLGKIYNEQGAFDTAKEIFFGQLKILLGDSHEGLRHRRRPDLIASFQSALADVYLNLGKYSEAEQLYSSALQNTLFVIRVFHASGQELRHIFHSMARLKLLTSRTREALDLWEISAIGSESALLRTGRTLPDGSLLALLEQMMNDDADIYSALLQNPTDVRFIHLGLAVALQHKGRAIYEASRVSYVVHHSSDEFRELFEHLNMLYTRMATVALENRTPAAELQSNNSNLLEEIHALEKEFARRSGSAPKQIRPNFSSIVDDVAARLPPDSVLVEVVAFTPQDFRLPASKQAGAPHYLAFLLSPDGRLRSVDLGEAARLDASALRLHDTLQSRSPKYMKPSRDLYDQVIRPLLPALGKVSRLYLSLDGQLNLVPFSAVHDGTNFLGDRYEITYLSAGRDLLRKNVTASPSWDAFVFADPDFRSDPGNAADADELRSKLRSARGFVVSNLPNLPGTRDEAERIKELLPSAQLLLGAEANEPALLRLHAPGILHIATHGLFFEEHANNSGSNSRGFEEDTGPPPANPLLRSALALAGAAHQTPRARRSLVPEPDGIVTALELASLNLWGTQLVVLSACNSGRGELKRSQGVYGLRRAIMTAGAETLVTSLWKVDDNTTAQLMQGYYSRLLRGVGRVAALQQAAQQIRQEYPHPYYWASFIVSGQAGPLRDYGSP